MCFEGAFANFHGVIVIPRWPVNLTPHPPSSIKVYNCDLCVSLNKFWDKFLCIEKRADQKWLKSTIWVREYISGHKLLNILFYKDVLLISKREFIFILLLEIEKCSRFYWQTRRHLYKFIVSTRRAVTCVTSLPLSTSVHTIRILPHTKL